MPLHMSAKDAAKLTKTGKASVPTPKALSVPSEPATRQKPGVPPQGAEVTHRLRKSLHSRFDNPPPVGSLARCSQVGNVYRVDVYMECGEVRFELWARDFADYFEPA